MLGKAASIHGPRSYIPAAGSNVAASGKLAPSYLSHAIARWSSTLSHGRFGMIQPVPDKKQADGRSVLYDVGCIGRLTSFRELPTADFLSSSTDFAAFDQSASWCVDPLGFRSVEINLDGFAKDIQPGICEDKAGRTLDLLTDYANQRELSVHWDELKAQPTRSLSTTSDEHAAGRP